MQKVLITGGAGYIGSVLAPKLLSEGYQVTVLDSFMFGQTSLLDVCNHPNFNVIRGDVRDEKLLKDLTTKHDILIPLACLVGAPLCDRDPHAAQVINCDVIKKMNDWKSKDQILVYPCTNSGYGIGQAGIHCDENTPLNPISVYGKVKVEAETYLLEKGESVTFRLATVFGISPRMRLDLLVNDFTYRAVNDGFIVLFEQHFKRNYLHVRDAAEAFVHTIKNYSKMKGEAYNVGISDANISKKELCERIARFVPKFTIMASDLREDPDKRNYIISNEKIEKTGFRTKVSLDAGIQELIKGYQVIKRNQFANV
jgi:nucleoside-diphosphate-sugar epimerase